jgi:4-hydroxybenzoate polyprenyltransferase
LYKNEIPRQDTAHFFLLMLASVFIAAAGYIVNDYFDINIDEVNKPQRMVVDKIIHRRGAIALHFIFNTAGIACTVLALSFWEKWYLILANLGCMALLWFYSTTFKKQLLIGNIVIAVLTAWTILIIFFSKVSLYDAFGTGNEAVHKFFRIAILYAGFAFITTLIREAVKDMEDRDGDEKYGCKTMPIVWGMHASKVYVAVWLIALIAILVIVQVYVLQFRWWWPAVYNSVLIVLPLLYIFFRLLRAGSIKDFHALSSWIKFVMLTGILSMVFFYFYL